MPAPSPIKYMVHFGTYHLGKSFLSNQVYEKFYISGFKEGALKACKERDMYPSNMIKVVKAAKAIYEITSPFPIYGEMSPSRWVQIKSIGFESGYKEVSRYPHQYCKKERTNNRLILVPTRQPKRVVKTERVLLDDGDLKTAQNVATGIAIGAGVTAGAAALLGAKGGAAAGSLGGSAGAAAGALIGAAAGVLIYYCISADSQTSSS